MFGGKLFASRPWLKTLVITLVILFALAFASLRGVIYYLNHHKAKVETWFTEFMQQTVQMGSLDAHWHGGKPSIHFHDLAILGADNKTILSKINNLDVRIGLWRSLWNGQLTPSHMVASGARLNLIKNAAGQICFGEIQPGQSTLINIDSIKLKGSLNLSADKGHVDLKLAGVNLVMPKVFDGPQQWRRVSGHCQWERNSKGEWLISGSGLQAETMMGKLSGDIKTAVQPGASPVMDMAVNFDVGNLSKLEDYLPRKIMDQRLHKWLTHAIQSGALRNGKLIVKGPLQAFPFDHGEGQFLASADVQKMHLRFNSDWQPLTAFDAKLVFQNRQMSLRAVGGGLGNCKIKQAVAEIKNLAAPFLTVDGELIGDLGEAVAIINHSPLQQTIGKEIQNLTLSGPMSLNLHLGTSFALHRPPIEIKGNIDLQGSQCQVGKTALIAKDLQGKIHFTESTVFADNLDGSLFSSQISLSIKSIKEQSKANYTQVALNGELDIEQATEALGVKLLPQVEGRTNFQAQAQLHHSGDPTPDEIFIASSLQGISLDFPEPLQKDENSALAFTSHLMLANNGTHHLAMNLGDEIKLRCDINTQPTFSVRGAAVQFGKGEERLAYQPGQLVLDGHWSAFDWDDWQALSTEMTQHSKATRPNLTPVIHLSFDELAVLGQSLTDVKLNSHKEDSAWLLRIKSHEVNGVLRVPEDYPDSALKIDIDNLALKDVKAGSRDWDPEDIPPMNIDIAHFSVDDINLGRLELNLTPGKDMLEINRLSANTGNMQLMASGAWHNHKDFKKTVLTGSIKAQDTGQVLQQLGVSDNVVGAAGQANFTLAWFDTVFPDGLASLYGQVHLQFKSGRIKKLSKETQATVGLARIINLLSLQSLPRRLSLDFSDLNESGYHFDTLEGNLLFKNGTAYAENLAMEGTVAHVQLGGKIGLKEKDFHLQLLITPHVTSSIPVVAAIAGGPVAGIVAWVGEKVVRRAADKVTSLTYNVTGPWDNPIVAKKG